MSSGSMTKMRRSTPGCGPGRRPVPCTSWRACRCVLLGASPCGPPRHAAADEDGLVGILLVVHGDGDAGVAADVSRLGTAFLGVDEDVVALEVDPYGCDLRASRRASCWRGGRGSWLRKARGRRGEGGCLGMGRASFVVVSFKNAPGNGGVCAPSLRLRCLYGEQERE